MFLAIDIGNTNIKLAIFKGKRILHSWRLPSDKKDGFSRHKKRLRNLLTQRKLKNICIDEIIICSVVPKLTSVSAKALRSLFKRRPLILGRDIIAPIKNLYRRPEQVGQDRLANAVAAVSKYGAPVIVVDFGTALTFDLISAKGGYLGGVIVPGMETSLKALIKQADLLPEIGLARPLGLLGRETSESIRNGLIYGYSFLVEGVLGRLKKRLRRVPCVVATGGEAPLMADYCRSINRTNQNLTLEGLRLIYEKRRKRAKKLKKDLTT